MRLRLGRDREGAGKMNEKDIERADEIKRTIADERAGVRYCQGRIIGSLYISSAQKGWPGNWMVNRQGDGTLEGDTVHLGIFWRKSNAAIFRDALEELGCGCAG